LVHYWYVIWIMISNETLSSLFISNDSLREQFLSIHESQMLVID
jgi:hypothetical protein